MKINIFFLSFRDYLIIMVLKLHKPSVNIWIGFLQIEDAKGCDGSQRTETLELPVSVNKHLTFYPVKTKLRTILSTQRVGAFGTGFTAIS